MNNNPYAGVSEHLWIVGFDILGDGWGNRVNENLSTQIKLTLFQKTEH